MAKFFFCMFMDQDKTEQAWSIKDLLYGIKHQNMINSPCGTKPVSRACKIAPSCRSGSQSEREIQFILPARGASHIIINHYCTIESMNLNPASRLFVWQETVKLRGTCTFFPFKEPVWGKEPQSINLG